MRQVYLPNDKEQKLLKAAVSSRSVLAEGGLAFELLACDRIRENHLMSSSIRCEPEGSLVSCAVYQLGMYCHLGYPFIRLFNASGASSADRLYGTHHTTLIPPLSDAGAASVLEKASLQTLGHVRLPCELDEDILHTIAKSGYATVNLAGPDDGDLWTNALSLLRRIEEERFCTILNGPADVNHPGWKGRRLQADVPCIPQEQELVDALLLKVSKMLYILFDALSANIKVTAHALDACSLQLSRAIGIDLTSEASVLSAVDVLALRSEPYTSRQAMAHWDYDEAHLGGEECGLSCIIALEDETELLVEPTIDSDGWFEPFHCGPEAGKVIPLTIPTATCLIWHAGATHAGASSLRGNNRLFLRLVTKGHKAFRRRFPQKVNALVFCR